MNPFEHHTYEILIPKQHVIEDLKLSEYNCNSSREFLIHNENLLKLAKHTNGCFRYHIIQGEILRFFVIFQLKNRTILPETMMKDLENIYPKLKFSVQMMKNIDAKSSLEMNIPNIAKFLNNQTFNSQYEEKACFLGDFYDTPNLAYEYAFDKKNNLVIYLLYLPILNAVDDLEANLKINLKIVYAQIEIKGDLLNEEIKKSSQLFVQKNGKLNREDLKKNEPEKKNDDIYNHYLDIIQKHMLKKQKKDLFVHVEKKVRLLSPFQITTENYQKCFKSIILIRVKNNLKKINMKDTNNFSYPQSSKLKSSMTDCCQDMKMRKENFEKDVSIYVKNAEFMLSNSSCKSIYNLKERETFFPGLAENFLFKLMGIENEKKIGAEDEFNIVINLDQMDYDNSKYIKSLQPLILPCALCQNDNPQNLDPSQDSSVINRSNKDFQKTFSNSRSFLIIK